MLYSKKGSIPKPFSESVAHDGWIEVPEPPAVQEGLEVVWWYPPGWLVRMPKPAPTADVADWSWSQSEQKWIPIPRALPVVEVDTDAIDGGNAAETFSIDGVTGADTVTASASPSS